MKKSELIEMLQAVEGDPDIIIRNRNGEYGFNDVKRLVYKEIIRNFYDDGCNGPHEDSEYSELRDDVFTSTNAIFISSK
jgi:hypothetical protein